MRLPLGEKKHNAVLSIELVKRLRELWDSGVGPRELGRIFGIDHAHALRVARGDVWKKI
jgi:hypothetical protein